MFVVYEVAEMASRTGEGAVLPFVGILAGFRSGDCTGGDEVSEADSLLAL